MDTREVIVQALAVSTATKAIELGAGALGSVPELFTRFFPGRSATVVADLNTWDAAGAKVHALLEAAGVPVSRYIFAMEHFHAELAYVDELDRVLEEKGSVLVAVGSGVINDLCKLSSYRHSQQYMCVATAASVDGFTSASAIVNDERGAKINIQTSAPCVVVADLDVLSKAPWQYNAAGYADLAAKVSSGAGWIISDLFGTEPIHEAAWHITRDSLGEMLDDPDGIRSGRPETIEKLFLGLTLCGIGMELARSSRPASCEEHLYSHYLDMTGHLFHGQPVSHGNQVAIGTLVSCALYDALCEMDLSDLDVDGCVERWPSLESEQQRALALFADFPVPTLGYEEITKKWQPREEVRVQLTKVKEGWPELRRRLREQTYTYERMKGLFERAGAPSRPEDIGITNADLRRMTDYVQMMRWRVNPLDLAKRAGVYDALLDKVFGKGGVFDATVRLT